MQTERPYVLTIAGFDPSSGAGLTADIKAFEQLKVYGLSVCTGLTIQTEDEFISVNWRDEDSILNEIKMLFKKYPVKAVKTGIFPSFSLLKNVIDAIRDFNPQIKIIVDPVYSSSTGFVINKDSLNESDYNFLKKITLITPNQDELKFLAGNKPTDKFIHEVVKYTAVLLKGGHHSTEKGKDVLYTKEGSFEFYPSDLKVFPKHGSGCVLSAAITSFLALDHSLKDSCSEAKKYTEKFLSGNKSLLGFHNV